MRAELLNYLKEQKFKNYMVSEELPFTSSNVALYLKNAKRIYVDVEQVTQEPFLQVFGTSISADVHSVRIYFTTDAKQLPSDYNTVVSAIRSGKAVTISDKFFRREVTSQTTFENDVMLTEFEFRFTKLS
jgi:hypothetical protein